MQNIRPPPKNSIVNKINKQTIAAYLVNSVLDRAYVQLIHPVCRRNRDAAMPVSHFPYLSLELLALFPNTCNIHTNYEYIRFICSATIYRLHLNKNKQLPTNGIRGCPVSLENRKNWNLYARNIEWTSFNGKKLPDGNKLLAIDKNGSEVFTYVYS